MGVLIDEVGSTVPATVPSVHMSWRALGHRTTREQYICPLPLPEVFAKGHDELCECADPSIVLP